MAQLPSIPKGTRDYSPEIMVKRNYIFDTIKSVFKLYGYKGTKSSVSHEINLFIK